MAHCAGRIGQVLARLGGGARRTLPEPAVEPVARLVARNDDLGVVFELFPRAWGDAQRRARVGSASVSPDSLMISRVFSLKTYKSAERSSVRGAHEFVLGEARELTSKDAFELLPVHVTRVLARLLEDSILARHLVEHGLSDPNRDRNVARVLCRVG